MIVYFVTLYRLTLWNYKSLLPFTGRNRILQLLDAISFQAIEIKTIQQLDLNYLTVNHCEYVVSQCLTVNKLVFYQHDWIFINSYAYTNKPFTLYPFSLFYCISSHQVFFFLPFLNSLHPCSPFLSQISHFKQRWTACLQRYKTPRNDIKRAEQTSWLAYE